MYGCWVTTLASLALIGAKSLFGTSWLSTSSESVARNRFLEIWIQDIFVVPRDSYFLNSNFIAFAKHRQAVPFFLGLLKVRVVSNKIEANKFMLYFWHQKLMKKLRPEWPLKTLKKFTHYICWLNQKGWKCILTLFLWFGW